MKKSLLLAVSAALSGSLAYGQVTAVPVVPPGSVGPGYARPYSWVIVPAYPGATVNLVDAPGQNCSTSNPCYYTEAQIWTAYGLPPLQARGNYGQGITIGIVDAYYDPDIAQNLANFSTYYNLPLGSATTSISCSSTPTLTVTNQTGGSPSGVAFNANWAVEANLDVQQAHAMAPCANILLIAAASNSDANLYAGVQYAYAHSDLVTNSYGGSEFAGEAAYDSYFSGSPVPLLFSSGDTAGVSEYPCMSPYSTCVGGTTLQTTPASFRTSEYPWDEGGGGGGGGCSSGGEPIPAYQTGFSTPKCGALRGAPDIAALADPETGVWIALSNNVEPETAIFCCVGGTSLASPLTAGILANVDAAREAAGKTRLPAVLNNQLYAAASYGVLSANPPYGNDYRAFYFDVFTGGTTYPATLYWDLASGLGVGMFSPLGNYLITDVP